MTAPNTTPLSDMKLYQLAQLRDVLDDMLTETEGELTPEIEERLNALDGAIEEKIERIGLYAREQDAECKKLDEEIKRLTARKKARERASKGLKDRYLMPLMIRLAKLKVNGLLCSVAVQNSPISVEVAPTVDLEALAKSREFHELVDMRHIPEHFEYSIIRENVIAAFQSQQPLPEGITAAQGKHVRIR